MTWKVFVEYLVFLKYVKKTHLDLEVVFCMNPISNTHVQGSPYKKASCSMHNHYYLVPLRGCKSSQSLCLRQWWFETCKFFEHGVLYWCLQWFMFIDKWHFLSLVIEKTMIEKIVILFENEFKKIKNKIEKKCTFVVAIVC